MMSPRWKKIVGDFKAAQSRFILMTLSLAMGGFALCTIVAAYVLLSQELPRNYLETNPASAIIDVGHVTDEVLSAILSTPEIVAAEPMSIEEGRVRTAGGEWQRLLLFVVDSFDNVTLNRASPEKGSDTARTGEILLERSAETFLGSAIGDDLFVQLPGLAQSSLNIVGTVHDASLAPASQEQTAYGYITLDTLTLLGGPSHLELVKVQVRDAVFDTAKIDEVVTTMAHSLQASGINVHQVQIPPAGLHPHQNQLNSVLSMFLIFAVLELILSSILTAAMLSSMLALHIKQIAIMKSVGATSGQITAVYMTMICIVAAIATAIALPLGLKAGEGLAWIAGQVLNVDVGVASVPLQYIALLAIGGIVTPLVFVWFPVRQATRTTVREALADYGVSRDDTSCAFLQRALRGFDRTLALALRNAFRRRGRLALNTALLGIAGAMFLAAMNVESAWQSQLVQSAASRDYNLEVQLATPLRPADAQRTLADIPGVNRVAFSDMVHAAVGRDDGLLVVRTYPDGGHGSLTVRTVGSISPQPEFLHGTMGEGAVVNQAGWGLLGRPAVGSTIRVGVEDRLIEVRLTGVFTEAITPATLYVPAVAFDDLAGRPGQSTILRISGTDNSPEGTAQLASRVEAALGAANIEVEQLTTEQSLAAAQAGHVQILVVVLLAIAAVMAGVGTLGLGASQSANVTERTREFGIMRTIGAPSGVLLRNILAEGVFTALVSIPIAILAGIPIGYGIGIFVGNLAFGMALPLSISVHALGGWLALLLLGSVLASLLPALRAIRLTIRQTLAHV